MQSLWDDREAAAYTTDLQQRVYTSRLLGREKSLVLHGGGNTSVKIREKNVFGDEEEILYIKGSGWDLETITEAGFAPVRMAPVLRLATLDSLSDPQMVNELRSAMTNASAPTPSVETILHAILPYKFVDHTHADAVVIITNTPNGLERIRECYGDLVVVIPYVMPGFDLAKLCARIFPVEASDRTIGMVLMNHGIFSFGDTARTSYERMLDLVSRAEHYLAERGAWQVTPSPADPPQEPVRDQIAALRRELSEIAGFPLILSISGNAAARSFARREDLPSLALQGPATPDHVIRTKRLPLIGRDVRGYADEYKAYFEQHAPTARQPLTMLDPAPRVILDPDLGLVTAGRSAKDAAIVEEIYSHTIEIIMRAAALGGWQALPAQDIFAVEYWDLEQAKLRKQGRPPIFAGEVALVTGAASGIGAACVQSLLARGAAVVGLDIAPSIAELHQREDFLGLCCDIADEQAVAQAFETTARAFGGLDMLILNAGIFPKSSRIEALDLADWDRVMRINLDANVSLMRQAYTLLKQAPRGGRVVIIGSKNVPAPGPGAAAYSASKAALVQLARIAALEWGADRIRVNVIHPNMVFDTALWTEEVLRSRAQHYGMTVEEYKTNNVLRVEVTSHDVGELAAEMCGPLFAKTTGAQVPVDGGNERVI